jgi:ligand-binding sensor domain-containing protein
VFPSPNVIFGTYNGLSILKYDNGIFSNQGDLKGMNESLRFMAIDNSNIIWASHPYRGIYKIILAADNHSFNYELLTEKDGLPSTLHNNVFRVKNRVMFTTDRGVYEYDAATKRFIPSPLLFNIFGDMVMQYLNEDADGNIWFCTGKDWCS